MQVEESQPALRLCEILKKNDGSCGFHLSRTQSDPYPWVSNVDDESPAGVAGLSVGDCVLEVNGEDILGLKISQVAERVRAKPDNVLLLVWNACSEAKGTGPAFLNLQKFSSYFESAVQLLECPVCLEIASLPTYQCSNGHIVCGNCRPRTHKCPICRVLLSGRGRCLLAEKLNLLLTRTFALKDEKSASKSSETTSKPQRTRCGFFSTKTKRKEPKFCCPWSPECGETIETAKTVLEHVKLRHGGPLVLYYMRSPKVTILRPSQNGTVYVQDDLGTIFFAQVAEPDIFFISVLGDDSKADSYEYSVENGSFLKPNSLSTPREQILARKSFFTVPGYIREISLELRLGNKSN